MELELLVVPDCPHEAEAVAAARAAAGQAGPGEIAVRIIVIDTDERARAEGFAGSPTFLINGVDPFAEPGAAIGLACRIYSTTAGPAGVPDLARLRAAWSARVLPDPPQRTTDDAVVMPAVVHHEPACPSEPAPDPDCEPGAGPVLESPAVLLSQRAQGMHTVTSG
ncbi:MAG TPA: hypothetical protein VIC62_24360 [Nakamurella sp.]